ncbi:hypothetical protein PFNF135_02758 [Plasmodium falciparum NF135/5.C10]|uniref:Uncharacterized protein n=1 Tax=Plasmodium falciparum NF135/5.C10 TaxID=1036726 RepID=W4III5_PLAFA|nr:hypothetical protein PFNF135_02758 [Plasmodium falciparum NF135/5.C10]
MNIKLYNIIE